MKDGIKITPQEMHALAYAINKAMDEAQALTNCFVSDDKIKINAAGEKEPVQDLWERFRTASLIPVARNESKEECQEDERASGVYEEEPMRFEEAQSLKPMLQAFFRELLAPDSQVDVEPELARDEFAVIVDSKCDLAKVERWIAVMQNATVIVYGHAPQLPQT